jgi:hypothetical protein
VSEVRWFAAVCALTCIAESTAAEAQTCPAATGDFSQGADLSVRKYGGACTVPNGGYAKVNTIYELHVLVSVNGWCQLYARDGQGQCTPGVPGNYYNRTAVGTNQGITGNPYGYVVYGNTDVQTYNTCGNGNCTPVNTSSNGNLWYPSTEGVYAYTTLNTVGGGTLGSGSQYCNMSGFQFSELHPVVFTVLKCEPKFQGSGASAPIPHIGVPASPDKIQIFLPNTMSSLGPALDAAITDLNTQISGTGIVFEKVTSTCGSGPRCISVESASQGNCGFAAWDSTDAITGVMTGGLRIQLQNTWATWSADSSQRTFAHELASLLGLNDYSTTACLVNDAAMQPAFACGPDEHPSKTVKIDDSLPIIRTVYGGQTRLSCGF